MDINIIPLEFKNIELLNLLVNKISFDLKFKVNIINRIFDIKKTYSNERKQYYSSEILATVIDNTKDIEGYILILTELDLYIPVLTFIFGEAQLNGRYSIISVCRLHEEFYSGITDNELFNKRVYKEILHELGHNFGLYHCIDWDCVMHTSNSIEEVDIKGNYYCKECLDSIAQKGIFIN